MGARGPLAKDERNRKRDNVARDQLVITGEVHGFELPTDLLDDGDSWHPAVTRWWDSFRSSPMAQRVETDVQWDTLAAAMLLYQDYLRCGSRGRAMRMTEFRAFFASYYVTPGDLRRNGLEIVEPAEEVEESDATQQTGTVSQSFIERRERILNGENAEQPKAPAKKAAARKKPAAKK